MYTRVVRFDWATLQELQEQIEDMEKAEVR